MGGTEVSQRLRNAISITLHPWWWFQDRFGWYTEPFTWSEPYGEVTMRTKTKPRWWNATGRRLLAEYEEKNRGV